MTDSATVPEPAAGVEPAAEETTPLERLLALQDEDVHADQLAHRRRHLPEQAGLDEIGRRITALATSSRDASERRAALAVREAQLERDTAEVVARIAAIEQRSRSAAAASYRDQEAMAAEVASLGRRRSELEEHELEVLEEIEPLDAELAVVAADRQELEAQAAATSASLAAAAAGVDAEIAASKARRPPLVAVVPGALLDEYERLRSRLDGVGVARLVHGMCSGCHLTLSATEVDHLRRAAPGAVAHCEQCGRILVP